MTTSTYTCERCGVIKSYGGTRQRPTHCVDCRHKTQNELRKWQEHTDPEWVLQAKCREVDPELFFDGDLIKTGAYRVVCQDCQVSQQCLTYAHTMRETHGIWGGLSYAQRRYLVDRGAGPTTSTPGDVRRCRNCGAWKEAHRFCTTCVARASRKRLE
jgi:WhiB family redox-sensing transcriptional regulator